MIRPLAMIVVAGMALLGATAADAGTHWSVDINLPAPSVLVTNGGYYVSQLPPVYYVPVPTARYSPAPVNFAPPVYAAPQGVYSNERPVYEAPYRTEPYRASDGDRYSRWERHREIERARWERTRHDEQRRWDRDEHGRDHRDSDQWWYD